jgi:hypothetical protein
VRGLPVRIPSTGPIAGAAGAAAREGGPGELEAAVREAADEAAADLKRRRSAWAWRGSREAFLGQAGLVD